MPWVRKYYLSSPMFTVQVNTNLDDVIVWTAPVAQKFIGQEIARLKRWSKADVVEVIGFDGWTGPGGRDDRQR